MKFYIFARKLFENRIFATALCLLCAVFIFSNSLKTADVSSEDSGKVAKLVSEFTTEVLKKPTEPAEVEGTVRKLAHFAEFMLLGALSYYAKLTYDRKSFAGISFVALYGAFVALTDESFQYLSTGRSPEVKDVWIDIFGFLLAVAIFIFAYLLFINRKTKKVSPKLS